MAHPAEQLGSVAASTPKTGVAGIERLIELAARLRNNRCRGSLAPRRTALSARGAARVSLPRTPPLAVLLRVPWSATSPVEQTRSIGIPSFARSSRFLARCLDTVRRSRPRVAAEAGSAAGGDRSALHYGAVPPGGDRS